MLQEWYRWSFGCHANGPRITEGAASKWSVCVWYKHVTRGKCITLNKFKKYFLKNMFDSKLYNNNNIIIKKKLYKIRIDFF